MYSLPVPEAGSLEARCWQGPAETLLLLRFPLRLWVRFLLASSSGGCPSLASWACTCITPASASLFLFGHLSCVSLFSFYKVTCHKGLGPTLMTSSYLPNYIPNDSFQIRSHSGLLEVRASTYMFFWGKTQFNSNCHWTFLCLSFFTCRLGTKILASQRYYED